MIRRKFILLYVCIHIVSVVCDHSSEASDHSKDQPIVIKDILPETEYHLRPLGVKLTNNGFVYKGYYYSRGCSKNQLYHALKSCSTLDGGIDTCLPLLYKENLIGRRQMYIRNVHGLGISFANGGVLFYKIYYKLKCSQDTFTKLMRTCINVYGQTNICLAYLQKKNMLGLGHLFKHINFRDILDKGHITSVHHKQTAHQVTTSEGNKHVTDPITVKFINGRLKHEGKLYRLHCTQKHFLLLLKRCVGRFHHQNVCLHRLAVLKIITPYT